MRGGECHPLVASRIAVYSLSKALAISPLEVYNLPVDLFSDMLQIHGEVEKLKMDEMDKEMRKVR